MNVIKVNPMLPVRTFSNVIDEIFNRSLSEFTNGFSTLTSPSVNVREEADAFFIDVAAPGLEKQDFQVNLDKDMLTISVAKEQSSEEGEEGKWSRKEFNFSSFSRSFHIPESVNPEDITAGYDKGILTVRLAKKEEMKDKAPRTIEIK
ncbi:MAG: Hsp20/alpha crystallin family protein [Saprospiraceae bacterium]|nr:Hsp20/alpha crystallin family protein [Saprospiraceae bacterium]